MKNVIPLIMAVAVAVLATSCGAVVDKMLEKMAEETQKACPIRLDELTLMDSVKAESPKTLHYFYSINIPRDSLGPDFDFGAMEQMLEQGALNSARSKDAAPLRKTKAVLRHTYLDANGQLIFETDITPEKYGKQP